ncbi:unnamed protein product [Camellia sinensis]
MKTSKLLTILFFSTLSFFTHTAFSDTNCQPSSCSIAPIVRFPFHLANLQDDRCGVPGFGLSCNSKNKTILTLPLAGEFIVTYIDYNTKWIYINDPDSCIPKRLQIFTLYGSPFISVFPMDITFLHCSLDSSYDFQFPIYCLSNYPKYVVVASSSSSVPLGCQNLSRVSVPVDDTVYRYQNPGALGVDLMLTWRIPGCVACEAKGGTCGYKNVNRRQIGCFNLPSQEEILPLSRRSKAAPHEEIIRVSCCPFRVRDYNLETCPDLPRQASIKSGLAQRGSIKPTPRDCDGIPSTIKYGIAVGVGIPGLGCLIIALAYYIEHRTHSRRRQHDAELSNPSITLQPLAIAAGLDGSTIESYPKTVLGESSQLPKPSDGTCSICLAEYQPKETLRTIPECNHYFHATCIDKWLRRNATCPLCRKPPDRSSVVTPSSTMSLSLSSSATT